MTCCQDKTGSTTSSWLAIGIKFKRTSIKVIALLDLVIYYHPVISLILDHSNENIIRTI